MSETLIELRNVVKKYDDVAVVNNLSLEIKKGEIFGFLGPNGAGKSTSINMMVGLLKPTSGNILFNGKDSSYLDEKEIGICPQDVVLWNNLTCLKILEKLHLTDKKDELVSSLSGGMKRRMNIAMATIHNPSIVVLDEPSEGLDPQSRRLLWDYILHQKELGHTVILTTHLMDEADMLSDRVAIIDHGQLLKLDTPKKLKQIIGNGDTVQLELDNHKDNEGIISELKTIGDLNNIFESDEKIILVLLDAVKKLPDIIHLVESKGSKIADISIRQNTLEDVFIELTGRQLRE